MDAQPENLLVGVVNPYALTESVLGRKVDWSGIESIKIMEDVLETDYDELFDIKYKSPLYPGLVHNTLKNEVESVDVKKVVVRTTENAVTPDLSEIRNLSDLERMGIDNLREISVRDTHLRHGHLNVTLDVPKLNKTLTNLILTKQIKDIVFADGAGSANGWTPPNTSWKDMGDFFKGVVEYNDPIQGAVPNCYFIAAIGAIAWADPYSIVHRVRATGTGETARVNAIQFYSKGGNKNSATKLIEVTDNTIVNASNNPIYCRSNDAGEIWPGLYEKAFAKWITNVNHDKPNITATGYGDPAKATAQLNNKTPHYFNTNTRTAAQLWSIVRGHSMSFKTIHPMTAWTYGSGNGKDYSGTNIVGNHAYTVLGWATKNNKNYVVLRNPWGVTEPAGLNTYQGLLSFFDKSFWRPINTIGNDGVFALEINSFKHYFATIGVAK